MGALYRIAEYWRRPFNDEPLVHVFLSRVAAAASPDVGFQRQLRGNATLGLAANDRQMCDSEGDWDRVGHFPYDVVDTTAYHRSFLLLPGAYNSECRSNHEQLSACLLI